MWLYGSGFPKSMNIGLAIDKKNGVESKVIGRVKGAGSTGINNVGNQTFVAKNQYEDGTHDIKEAQNEWQGWGTALKPAFEPIIVARKPFKGSLVDNVIKWGVGGINIDECRVGSSKEDIDKLNKEWDREWNTSYKSFADGVGGSAGFDYSNARTENKGLSGRFPANLILTYEQMTFDEVCGGFPDTKGGTRHNLVTRLEDSTSYGGKAGSINTRNEFNDSGNACRYFYCAKASKKDRNEGLEEFEEKKFYSNLNTKNESGERLDGGKTPIRKNTHPTVKPTELMQYLIRLVTPKGRNCT